MDEANIARVEAAVDTVAAAILGGAAALATFHAGGVGASLAAGCAAFGLAFAGLRRIAPGTRVFTVGHFAPVEIEPGELVLTEADIDLASAPLLLDDELPPPDPDSRVVQLFDPAAMPSPAELKSRSDRHLAGPQPALADSSRELFGALEDLRRSLR